MVIESGDWLFYGLVTDLQLGATDPRFADEQSEQRLPPGLARLLHGQTLYTNLEVLPALMLERGPEPGIGRIPPLAGSHRSGLEAATVAAAGQDHPAAPRTGVPGGRRAHRRDLRQAGDRKATS